MIKVVLDANQFVSALLLPESNPAKIIEMVRQGRIALVVSKVIIEEIRRVLSYSRLKKLHGRSSSEIDRFMDQIEKIAVVTPGTLSIKAVPDDPSDDKYLVCAVEGEAEFIISGDHHLKDLKVFQGIPIVDPATFLAIV